MYHHPNHKISLLSYLPTSILKRFVFFQTRVLKLRVWQVREKNENPWGKKYYWLCQSLAMINEIHASSTSLKTILLWIISWFQIGKLDLMWYMLYFSHYFPLNFIFKANVPNFNVAFFERDSPFLRPRSKVRLIFQVFFLNSKFTFS